MELELLETMKLQRERTTEGTPAEQIQRQEEEPGKNTAGKDITRMSQEQLWTMVQEREVEQQQSKVERAVQVVQEHTGR